LRGVTRKHFFEFIERECPDKYHELRGLYKTGSADKSYKEALYSKVVNPLRDRYGISGSYMKAMREKLK
jgi:hypothetical protein